MFSFVDIRLGLLLAAAVLVVRGQEEEDSEYIWFLLLLLQRCLTEEIGELKRGNFQLVASDLRSKTSWECLEEGEKLPFLFSSTFLSSRNCNFPHLGNARGIVFFPRALVCCARAVTCSVTMWCPRAKDALKEKRDTDERTSRECI